MANTITCWLGMSENGKFTPHSIFDYTDCLRQQQVVDLIDWSFSVATKETASRGWSFMAKWNKRVCSSEDPLVLAEILRQSPEYDLGSVTVFADTPLFNEIIASGLYYRLKIISPFDTVRLALYKTTLVEPIGDGKFLHHMEPMSLPDTDEKMVEAAVAIEERQMNRPKLTTRSQKSVEDNLRQMEEFNQAEGSSGDSFSGDGGETMTEDIDRSILRMSDILDDVCDNMGKHEQVMAKTNETVEVLKKRVAAAITLANGAAQSVRELNPATQESVDSLAASIGTIVSENEGFAEKTLKSISNMKKAVAILATVLVCTMFALIVVAAH